MPIQSPDHGKLGRKRMMQLFKLAAASSCLLGASLVNAQLTGDASRGLIYAQRQCSDCHAVQAGRALSPLAERIATFKDIANTPGMTPMALMVWFQSPHPNMPNLILDPADRDDVIAYIVSLRDRK
jgi:cytochrome c2